MRMVIAGPGALGCLIASMLCKGSNRGDHISLLDHNRERAALIDQKGIIYEKGDKSVTHQIPVFSHPEMAGSVDAVFLCVKSYDVRETLAFCAPLLGRKTLLIFMQNGMAHLREASQCGDAAPVFGTTTEGATSLGPGQVRHAGSGMTYLGFLQEQNDPQQVLLQEIASRLSAGGMQASVSSSIYQRLWNKLFINVGINALTVIYNCRNGELLTHSEAGTLMAQAIAEAETVARAEGVEVSSPYQRAVDVCTSTAQNISSMLQDIRNGRKTEIDAINGVIVELAKKHALPTPVNISLVKRVKEREKGFLKKETTEE